jgi:hypothetical protein
LGPYNNVQTRYCSESRDNKLDDSEHYIYASQEFYIILAAQCFDSKSIADYKRSEKKQQINQIAPCGSKDTYHHSKYRNEDGEEVLLSNVSDVQLA